MHEDSTRGNMPGRLLRLLSLLQSRREWSGSELAERLGVTDRTVRRDIDRLRALDYPVRGTTGTAGGYQLTLGRNLPPLLLDDDEAIATAVGLVTAADGRVPGIEESSMRALAKLEHMLPTRLRPRLSALTGATAAVERHPAAPRVDPTVLAVLASCCRDREVLAFDYRGRSGEAGARRVEPHSLVTVRGHWYLLAHDPDRSDWRTFRVDRIETPTPTRRSFPPRELPAPDAATYLTRSFASASYRYTVWVTVRLPAEEVRTRLLAPVPGDIDDRGPEECLVRISADSADLVTQYVAATAALDAEITIDAPAEISHRVRHAGRRLGPRDP
ncbi:putative DNA-binding transcriptional regulator YafY [Saccharopolyspora lacisalsi]|uniref:Putative DNA-binding transcriptional regulator YafY n=2 Tax=Halosaccharopolyspora lacisalsi TaxID=1000566 RepID=A0A839E0A1_9PSEU|nr:WYL domain-containing protein [Halosaccharopolyspora lacisalsi]MBA8825946.1 putative DNA-binding transcriptional regulator YafY [Halosaccharopolyspora lacisalsi]